MSLIPMEFNNIVAIFVVDEVPSYEGNVENILTILVAEWEHN